MYLGSYVAVPRKFKANFVEGIFYYSSKNSKPLSVTVTNKITGAKVNINLIRATFFKEIPSRKVLPYAHALLKNVFLPNQLPTAQIAVRLKHCYNAWEVLTGDQNILAIIKKYQIPFLSQPN